MKKDICCIGHITRDKIVTPGHTIYMSGGTSFYFAYALSHLPKDVSYELVTKVGADDMKAVNDMRAAGIEVKSFPSAHTVFFENIYSANPDERSQRVLAKADPFSIDELSGEEARVFHLGALLSDDFPTELVRYLSHKGLISIDAQGYLREVRGTNVYLVDWKDKREVLACTDMMKVNENEMQVVTGLSDPHEAALKLADWGVREALVTLGSAGSLILSEGHFYDIPAYKPRRMVDATGCGDTYMAGYLWCRCRGMGIEESGRFAAAMCTLKLEHSGPFDRTADDVLKVIQAASELSRRVC